MGHEGDAPPYNYRTLSNPCFWAVSAVSGSIIVNFVEVASFHFGF